MKWKTKDGKEIDVMDMDDNHAKNALAMIIRNNRDHDILNYILKGKEAYDAELKRKPKAFAPQGEIAQMMEDQMLNDEYGTMDDIMDDPYWHHH